MMFFLNCSNGWKAGPARSGSIVRFATAGCLRPTEAGNRGEGDFVGDQQAGDDLVVFVP